MNEIQPRDSDTAVGAVLPQRPPEPDPVPPVGRGFNRYLAPLLLAAIALAINVLAYLAPDPAAPTPEATIERAAMTVADKIKAAEQLKAHGDQLYEEGYSWFNDYGTLRTSHAAYTKAWELLTSQKYPLGGSEDDLIANTVQVSILLEHLRIRLRTLDESFARHEKFKGYLP